uniref:Protein Vpu n=1 Tax=Simian immunodeficiency virus TaxID=11723 RepID=B9V2V5_SIV|nr:vpu protein [Simian immunodeficiency virus]
MHSREIAAIIIGSILLAVTVVLWVKIWLIYQANKREEQFVHRVERLLERKEDEGYESDGSEETDLMELGNRLGFAFHML